MVGRAALMTLVALLVARRGRFRSFVRAALPVRVPLSVPLSQRSASGFGHGSFATGPERHDGGGSRLGRLRQRVTQVS